MTQTLTCGCTPECAIPYGTCHCGCGVLTRIAPQGSAERGWTKGQPVRYKRGHAPRAIEHRLSDLDSTKRIATCNRCGLVSVKRDGERWRCFGSIITAHKIVDVDEAERTGFCRACNTRVPVRRHTRDGWVCAPKKIESARAYREGIPIEERREAHAVWREANRDHLWARHLLKKYGLTIEQYVAMSEAQGGLYAICGGEPKPDDRGGILHVDHCHATGRVRGLLCASCNLVLGQIEDDPERARKLADYLVRHAALAGHPAGSLVVV
jgi:hypothetical protein